MKPLRPKRLGVEIKRELSNFLLTEYGAKIPAMTTITEVRLTPDLRQARVYYSVMGAEDDKKKVADFLQKIKGRLRSLIASRITMRFHPSLEFRLDDTLEYAQRIEDLIEQTHQEQETNESPSEPRIS
jgi:ribosome-binding factor A